MTRALSFRERKIKRGWRGERRGLALVSAPRVESGNGAHETLYVFNRKGKKSFLYRGLLSFPPPPCCNLSICGILNKLWIFPGRVRLNFWNLSDDTVERQNSNRYLWRAHRSMCSVCFFFLFQSRRCSLTSLSFSPSSGRFLLALPRDLAKLITEISELLFRY